MDNTIQDWIRAFVAAKGPFERVLELGSRDINGSCRSAFGSADYVGLDMIDGPGVDLVMNTVELVERADVGFFDCVVATSFFEHDRHFWLSLMGVRAHIKEGGWFVVTVPTLEFPLHEYPGDYYRYTPQAVREVLFKGFHDIEVFDPLWQHPPDAPHLKCQHIGAWGQR